MRERRFRPTIYVSDPPNRPSDFTAMINVHDYLIDHSALNWSDLLRPWAELLPRSLTPWLMNRFGDLFFIADDRSVHWFDVSGGTVERVAANRDEFADLIDEGDRFNYWFLAPLVDQVRSAGMELTAGSCYGFKISPVLGGKYEPANTCILSIAEHYGFHADLYRQIKDLPDGTRVAIQVEFGSGRRGSAAE